MNKCLPCPFCGGEAVKLTSIDGFTSIGCLNCNPFYGVMIQATTEAEAVAAWNSRAEHTCHNKNRSGTSFWCSKCDAATSDGFADVGGKLARFNYCPNCGCKVVK